jgi:uncharacterized oxidoreductase
MRTSAQFSRNDRKFNAVAASLKSMKPTGNTILVTGGGTGIGRGLAETLHRAGNQVVIAGRRRGVLQAVADANPGIEYRRLDVAEPDSINRLAADLSRSYPGLNMLVNNAGVMRSEDLLTTSAEIAEQTVAVNLLGPIRLTAALLPRLLSQQHAVIANITSALAFVPRADAPSYSATKAGLHAYTQSLRHQLRHTSVQVIEIIPPRVETDMLVERGDGPAAMSVNAFVAETFSLLRSQSDAAEIVVDAAKHVRFAARDGNYDDVFTAINS